MKENKTTVNGGIGFTGLLQVTFIVLKLIGIINWSWIWVLSPTWISIILVILVIIVTTILIRRLNK